MRGRTYKQDTNNYGETEAVVREIQVTSGKNTEKNDKEDDTGDDNDDE